GAETTRLCRLPLARPATYKAADFPRIRAGRRLPGSHEPGLRPQRPEYEPARHPRAGKIWPCDTGRRRKALLASSRAFRPGTHLSPVEHGRPDRRLDP